MPCPGVGPCQPWDLDLSCCLVSGTVPNPCLSSGEPVSQDLIDSAVLAASEFLWAATGRQFGCCQVTLNLCKQCGGCDQDCCIPGFSGSWFDSSYGFGYPWMPAHLADGSWINVSCPSCDSCTCDKCTLPLPYPTCSVDEFVLGGVIQDPESYKILDFKELAYTPAASGACGTACGDTITVTYGRQIPELVKKAAAEFACQLIKACSGAPCQLPQRVQSISRQGVTISFLDPMDFLEKGKSGIYLVDLAIKTYNPNMLMRRPIVYSPDVGPKWKVQTWGNGDGIGPNCT